LTASSAGHEGERAQHACGSGGRRFIGQENPKQPHNSSSRLPSTGGGKLRVSATRTLHVAALVGCAAALWAGTPGGEAPGPVSSAYLRNQLVRFHLAPVEGGQQPFSIGPWQFGARVSDRKPRDKRLNLYLVAPGTQHHAEGQEEFDHNDVINALPPGEAMVEWDVYWVIVLDPSLGRDLRSEQDLIVEAQAGFVPGDLFEFQDIPGQAFLRAFLEIDALDGLAPYRRRDGRLPRLIIVPAGFAIRARAALPEAESDATAAQK